MARALLADLTSTLPTWLYESMLHGRVLRPLNYRCRLISFDATRAKGLPGVRVIHDGDFLGVTAPSAAVAKQAME
jgi:hypothetical protein